MKVVPLDRSHVRGAAALHRRGRVWFYRGKAAPCVLRAFYDGYANRDYTLGAVAVTEGNVVAAACAATRADGARRWIRARRPWRSLCARIVGGRDMTQGGIGADYFSAAGADGKPAFLVSLAAAPGVEGDALVQLLDHLAAAAASRGVCRLWAPAADAAEMAAWRFNPGPTAALMVRDL